MGFDIDSGATGSVGPFLVWTPRGTQEGDIPGRQFYIRDKDAGKVLATEMLQRGVVFDFATLKTGWQESGGIKGVAPNWKWGDSPARLPANPGEGWKKGFSIRVALPNKQAVTWEQAGTAVFDALVTLAKGVDLPGPDQCPVVRMTGVNVMEFSVGKTVAPVLEVVKYVPRPDSLKEQVQVDAGDSWTAPPAAAAKPAAQPAPAMAGNDDFDEF